MELSPESLIQVSVNPPVTLIVHTNSLIVTVHVKGYCVDGLPILEKSKARSISRESVCSF